MQKTHSQKNNFKFLFALLLSAPVFLTNQAIIVESNTIAKVAEYTDCQQEPSKTMIAFDLDNVLVRSTREIGSDQWFRHMVGKNIVRGLVGNDAVNACLPTYYHVQFSIPLQLVETERPNFNCPQFIQKLQEAGYFVVCLTSRSVPMVDRTLEQLQNIGLSFKRSDREAQEIILDMPIQSMYKNGIIFSGNNNKGATLFKFLETIEFEPAKIIFVDDALKHVKNVEKAVEDNGIEFAGIRDSACDEWVANFDPAVADAQYEEFLQQQTYRQ